MQMKNKILYHYFIVSKLIDKRISVHGSRLYRELLEMYFEQQKVRIVIKYAFLEEKLGCDNYMTKTAIKELVSCNLISIVNCEENEEEDEEVIISFNDIFDPEANKEQLIGKAILC